MNSEYRNCAHDVHYTFDLVAKYAASVRLGLQVLKSDKKAIFTVAAQAQVAVD